MNYISALLCSLLYSFFGRGRGFYLRSVAPSSPKPSLTPLHVIGGDAALLAQSVAGLNLSFQGTGLGASNFINLTPNLSIKFNPQMLKTKLGVKFVQVVRVVGIAVSSVKFARYL